MRIITAGDLDRAFSFPELIEALRRAFRAGVVAPVRHHHTVALADRPAATLLLMPAWDDPAEGGADTPFMGVKIVSVYPDNASRGMPTIVGAYLLMDGATGEPLAIIDGQRLTLWRTAAASGLAASYLARPDASCMLMAGAGALAPYLIEAHASVRPLTEVLIWNREPARAAALATALSGRTFSTRAVAELEPALRRADIVSCATLSTEPLVRGAWLNPGAHLDLVGAFTPAMRESDDECMRRARIYVDTRGGALAEAGDIVQPIRAGAISASDLLGDLHGLCRGEVAGRASPDEITVFKSVGAALEDLAAATLAYAKTAAAASTGIPA